ncbi:MAG: hypothetical protein ABI845_02385 [Polaromonas sp.]
MKGFDPEHAASLARTISFQPRRIFTRHGWLVATPQHHAQQTSETRLSVAGLMQVKDRFESANKNGLARVEVLQPSVIHLVIRPGADLELQRNTE